MATLTEKQEAVKEVLGSKSSIRRFAADTNLHLEDLKRFITLIQGVIDDEEEAKKKLADNVAKSMQELRVKLVGGGYSETEATKMLAALSNNSDVQVTSGSNSVDGGKVKADRATLKKYEFEFTWKGKDYKATRTAGGRLTDEWKEYMSEKGYFTKDEKGEFILDDNGNKIPSLKAWVDAEKLQPIED